MALKTSKQGNAAILHRHVGFAVCPKFFESPAQLFRACSGHLIYQFDNGKIALIRLASRCVGTCPAC